MNEELKIMALLDKIYQLVLRLASKWSEPKEFLNSEEVRELLGISRATYFRLVKSGELVPITYGKRHYYRRDDLQHLQRRSV